MYPLAHQTILNFTFCTAPLNINVDMHYVNLNNFTIAGEEKQHTVERQKKKKKNKQNKKVLILVKCSNKKKNLNHPPLLLLSAFIVLDYLGLLPDMYIICRVKTNNRRDLSLPSLF